MVQQLGHKFVADILIIFTKFGKKNDRWIATKLRTMKCKDIYDIFPVKNNEKFGLIPDFATRGSVYLLIYSMLITP